MRDKNVENIEADSCAYPTYPLRWLGCVPLCPVKQRGTSLVGICTSLPHIEIDIPCRDVYHSAPLYVLGCDVESVQTQVLSVWACAKVVKVCFRARRYFQSPSSDISAIIVINVVSVSIIVIITITVIMTVTTDVIITNSVLLLL